MAAPTIGAIPTQYNGVTFRSRLEARWAMALTNLGLAWEYEPEGYQDGDTMYLPDFWLEDLDCFLEVKPDNEYDKSKTGMLVELTGKHVFITSGAPHKGCCLGVVYSHKGPNWGWGGWEFRACKDGHVSLYEFTDYCCDDEYAFHKGCDRSCVESFFWEKSERFVNDALERAAHHQFTTRTSPTISVMPANRPWAVPGMQVQHVKFGIGFVQNVAPRGDDWAVTIDFQDYRPRPKIMVWSIAEKNLR